MWHKWNIEDLTIEEVLEVIEDALCNHFEFKVEAGSIYFREY